MNKKWMIAVLLVVITACVLACTKKPVDETKSETVPVTEIEETNAAETNSDEMPAFPGETLPDIDSSYDQADESTDATADTEAFTEETEPEETKPQGGGIGYGNGEGDLLEPPAKGSDVEI